MKKTTLLIALALLIGGCRSTATNLTTPSDSPKKPALPPILTYQNDTYHLHPTANGGEYYRSGEHGYEWQKLLTLSTAMGNYPLQAFRQSMQQTLAQEGAQAEIEEHADHLQLRILYPPMPDNPHFNRYESNLMRYRQLPCGIIGLQYAERYPADSDSGKITAQKKAEEAPFQAYAASVLADIACPAAL